MATELSFLGLWSDSFHHFWNLLWLVPPSQGKFHARPRGAQLCNVPSWLTSPVRTDDIFLLSCCTASITGHRLLFGLFPWSSGQEKQGRKFNGQIVYRSKGVRGVGQRQHRGNKWKRGRTLVPPCCVYCGHSVCPACRAAPKACWSSFHVPLTFLLAPSWSTEAAVQLPSPWTFRDKSEGHSNWVLTSRLTLSLWFCVLGPALSTA